MPPIFLSMLNDKAGNFGIMFALLALPTCFAVGIAVDYGYAYTQRNALQNAADAAVLTAASSGQSDTAKLRAIAENMLKANLPADLRASVAILDFEVAADKHISISVSAKVPTTLTKFVKPEGLTVKAHSQALGGSDDKIEVALVLDNTYSMVGQKLTDLKTASNALLDVFEKVDTKKTKARFAIVPFSRYVNVGTAYRGASWLSVDDDSSTTKNVCTTTKPVVSQSGCTTTTKTSYNDGVPYTTQQTSCTSVVYGDPVTKCADQTTTTKWTGCVGSRKSPYDVDDTTGDVKYTGLMNTSCGAAVTPLTNNYTTLRAAIKAMVANNETYIAPGVLWGWNMLSSTQPFAEGLGYDEDVKKFIILMTDGTNTVSPSYPYHTGTSVTKSDSLLASVCANAKLKGVTIFTVAVGINAASSTATELGKCASPTAKAIMVEESSKLTSSFEQIASQIIAPRLTQ